MTIPQILQTYIQAELDDAMLYKELAKTAPKADSMLLSELAADELRHAREFQSIYLSMTGNHYTPDVSVDTPDTPYREILRSRVLDESSDYLKYAEQYTLTCQNDRLKAALLKAKSDENVHALKLLYLLSTQEQEDEEEISKSK